MRYGEFHVEMVCDSFFIAYKAKEMNTPPPPANLQLLKQFSSSLLEQRIWMHSHFPGSESILAIDILLRTANSTLSGTSLSIKKLLGTLPFSDVGIRRQVTLLEKNGWLRISSSKKDRRIRILVAENKLLRLLSQYEEFCSAISYKP